MNNQDISNPNEKNLLINLFETLSGKWFVFLGVFFMGLSSLPAIQGMESASLVFFILLLYTNGLFISGYFIRKPLPWTGNIFYFITLLAIPIILASIDSLSFNKIVDILISIFTIITIPLTTKIILKTLFDKLNFTYYSLLILLSFSTFIPKYLEISFIKFGFLRDDLETFISIVFFALAFIASNSLKNYFDIQNEKQLLGLNSLLVYVYLIIMTTNYVNIKTYGLICSLFGCLILFNVQKLNRIRGFKSQNNNRLFYIGISLTILSIYFAWFDITKLSIITFFNILSYISTIDELRTKKEKIFVEILSGIYFTGFMLFLLRSWEFSFDKQSLLMSIITIFLLTFGSIKDFEKKKATLFHISLLTSIGVWIKISIFDSWSVFTCLSLLSLSAIYMFNSIFYKRNVLSYISVVTFTIGYFSLITVINPEMSFYNYRIYALLLGFLYLSVGYLLQTRFSKPKIIETIEKISLIKEEDGIKFKKFLTTDIIKPYKFQDRFESLIPYLISEPLYNIALLLTSISLLVNLNDFSISIPSALFYLCIFKIYPSRLWIYFALTAATDGLLNMITNVMPEKYHNWGFIFISFNWFFIGVIIEEVFEAYERKGGKFVHIDKKYAQPFFQAALIVNIYILKYFFVDLLNIHSTEGWEKIQGELLQILIVSSLYILKIKSSVSKLWLYPCLIVFSLVMYFKSISIFGAEYGLILLTLLGFILLGVGYILNTNKTVINYLKSIVEYKLPKLDISSSFYKYHIHDFASPVYAFALISVIVSLSISAFLIPQYALYFAMNLEFEVSKLNITNLNTFYFVQIANFLLISVFLTIYYPKRIPLLKGDFEERKIPYVLKYMSLIPVILNFFWIFNFMLSINNLTTILCGIAFIWSIFCILTNIIQKEIQDFKYYYPTIILSSLSFLLFLFLPKSEILMNNIGYYFLFLGINFGISLYFTKISYLIYPIEVCFSVLLLYLSKDLNIYSSVFRFEHLLFCFTSIIIVVNYVLFKKYEKSIPEYSLIFNKIIGFISVSHFIIINLVILDNLFGYHISSRFEIIYFGNTLTLFLLSRIKDSKNYFVMGLISLGLFNFYYLSLKENFELGFIILSICFYSYLYNSNIIDKNKFSNFNNVFLLLFPISITFFRINNDLVNNSLILSFDLILITSIFYLFTNKLENSNNLKDLIKGFKIYILLIPCLFILMHFLGLIRIKITEYNYLSLLVLSSIIFATIAKNTFSPKAKLYLWEITAIFTNTTFVINLYIHKNIIHNISINILGLSPDMVVPQLILFSFGLTFILLSLLEIKPIEKQSCLYFGQILILIFPYFLFLNNRSENILFLFEFIAISMFFILLSVKYKTKAFLYFNVLVLFLLFTTEIPKLFISGSSFTKWSILLTFGLSTTILGIKMETRKEELKKLVYSISNSLKTWT